MRDMPLLDATRDAVAAAREAGTITASDAGAVAALMALARKIDLDDEYFQALMDEAHEMNRRPPSPDNVSLPTYLKYSDSLGLTPGGRKSFDAAARKTEVPKAVPRTADTSSDEGEGMTDELSAKRATRSWR